MIAWRVISLDSPPMLALNELSPLAFATVSA